MNCPHRNDLIKAGIVDWLDDRLIEKDEKWFLTSQKIPCDRMYLESGGTQ